MNNAKIIFLGTPEFAVKPLEALIKAGHKITAVVTAPDKPKGRKMALTPPPVKVIAENNKIPVYQPKNKNELHEVIKELQPDLAVVAAFSILIPQETLEIPKYGFLNVHPSLLPRWRGPSPIQSAILEGDNKTGVTIMLLNEKMDEGPMLASREFTIYNLAFRQAGLQFTNLHNALSELGAELLIETIPKWMNGEIKPVGQDNSKATYSKIIEKEDGLIDWNEPKERIERKIRAFTPWPGAYTFINEKRLIITSAELDKNNALEIKRVKPEGKNEMSFSEYIRGNPNALVILRTKGL